MIDVARFVAAAAGCSGAASFGRPRIPSPLPFHHGQDNPERVEKDFIQDRMVGATRRPVDVAGLAEPVETLCDR
jgi:hypothetical protein